MALTLGASHSKTAPSLVWCKRSPASRDQMYLIFHVTLHDHFIEGSFKYMGESSSKYHLGKSCEHRHYDSRDIVFLIRHVSSREHIFKGFCEFKGEIPSRRVTTFPCLVAIGLMQVEI